MQIRTVGLGKRYGPSWAVRDLDLAVPAGEVFGFLGPNGAGKSTTIRMLLGGPADQRRSLVGGTPGRDVTMRTATSRTCRRRWRCGRT